MFYKKMSISNFRKPKYCCLCRNTKLSLVHVLQKWHIYKCANCSFMFVYPYLTDRQLNLLYSGFDNNIFEKNSITVNDSKQSLRFINKYRDKQINMLDIGCGNGCFLEEASNNFWRVSGVEISSKLIKFLKRIYHFPIYQGNILSINIHKKYDILTLNQVIEHFPKPRLLIKRCFKLLNTNGLIYIATPNISSYAYKIRKDKFDYMIPPEHLSYFNKNTLCDILTSEGFKVLGISTWSYPVDMAGLIKHIFKRNKTLNSSKSPKTTINRLDIKSVKYLLFDQVLCKLTYKILNFNNGGTMIQVLAIKK